MHSCSRLPRIGPTVFSLEGYEFQILLGGKSTSLGWPVNRRQSKASRRLRGDSSRRTSAKEELICAAAPDGGPQWEPNAQNSALRTGDQSENQRSNSSESFSLCASVASEDGTPLTRVSASSVATEPVSLVEDDETICVNGNDLRFEDCYLTNKKLAEVSCQPPETSGLISDTAWPEAREGELLFGQAAYLNATGDDHPKEGRFSEPAASLNLDDTTNALDIGWGTPPDAAPRDVAHESLAEPATSSVNARPHSDASASSSQHGKQGWRAISRVIVSVLPGGSWWELGGQIEGSRPKDLFQSLGKLWRLCEADKGMLFLACSFLALAALSEVSMPHFLAAAIFDASSAARAQFEHHTRLLTVMTISCGVFSGLRSAMFSIINTNLVRRLRLRLYETLVSQDIAFFDATSVGDLTSRLGSDCQAVSHIVATDLNVILRNSLQGIGAMGFLVHMSWRMALVTALLCSLMWSCLLVYGRFQRRSARVVQDTVSAANQIAEETLSLARVVRTFGTEEQEVARYKVPLQRLTQISRRRAAASGLWTFGGHTIYYAAQVAAVFAGGAAVMARSITAEQLTKFILYAEWVVHATWYVGDHWAALMESLGSCDRVFQMLDLPRAPQLTHSTGRVLPHLQGKIEFRHVSFAYPTRPSVNVLDNVNLTVQPGEIVALVGLSGSGKSTLVNLLKRLYEPTHGEILIDGVPLHELDARWYRRQLGVVSQEPQLFSTGVASNIAYGGEAGDLSAADVERASRQAHAHEFVTSLPEGYATEVDNERLSGGQKQRIAIARALVRDPRILILDEATSALDAESEHKVQMALDEAMLNASGRRSRTLIVIAHRFSTVRRADRIVVMSAGRIVEVGSHKDLLESGGVYARLSARQLDALA